MTIQDKKVAVLAELKAGETVKDLAEKYEVNAMTISGWRRRERDGVETNKSQQIADIPRETVVEVLDEMKTKAKQSLTDKQFSKVELQLDTIGKSVEGLREMDDAFKTVLTNLLQWANMKIDEDMKISEWTQLVKGVSDMHKTIFSNESNVVNIVNNQQNNVAEVDAFKAGFRN